MLGTHRAMVCAALLAACRAAQGVRMTSARRFNAWARVLYQGIKKAPWAGRRTAYTRRGSIKGCLLTGMKQEARLTQGAGASRHGVRGLDTKRIHAGGLFVAWFLVALHQA